MSQSGFDDKMGSGTNPKYYEQRGTAVLNQIKEENLDKVIWLLPHVDSCLECRTFGRDCRFHKFLFDIEVWSLPTVVAF